MCRRMRCEDETRNGCANHTESYKENRLGKWWTFKSGISRCVRRNVRYGHNNDYGKYRGTSGVIVPNMELRRVLELGTLISQSECACLFPQTGYCISAVSVTPKQAGHNRFFSQLFYTSWNTRRCSGFKIRWKNSSDMFVAGFWIVATPNLVGIG
jgi:hypothetical protein